ncbi:amidase [Paracoccus marinaquae]|uniref:Amidase n=1 Tax=Paracoccus marinaquae TaxID=2841926 RepID=A0ABS6AMQ9_9RHOB|nr:amidase family protein [Paracoccus marinaquae]MBU3031874.1 amidase [Paracoccus marinaquae]
MTTNAEFASSPKTPHQQPRPAFTGPDLCRLDATEVVSLLKRREVSPAELLDAAFTRLRAVEPAINATPILCEDRARAAAQKLDFSAADHPGWLAGLPIAIKDLTAVAGVRTTFGTRGLADFVPEASDPLVERLEARGGVVVGKTNTPEFGAGGNTFNDVFGPTLNPWDTRLNAGGSSGGAAASLAAGEVWLSHGSDHGGSLRTPAAFCGIVGLRPSPGRAGGGSDAIGFMIEGAQGPMARTVRDCALFLDSMAGYEPRFPISYPAPDTSFQDAVERADPRLKIAFTTDLNGFSPVDAEVETHLRGVMTALEREGATVEETCPALPNLERTYHVLRGEMWATMGRRLPDAIRRHFKPTLEENMAFGEALTMADIADAQLDRTILYRNMLRLFDRFDVLALPTVGCLPHPQEEEWVREVGGRHLTGYMDWLRFAFLATVTGLPAISVPAGIGPRGLPVGLQLIGKLRGEAALLAAARVVEISAGGPLGPIDPVVRQG